MSLKEPKQVKAVENTQSAGTRQKVLVRQRGGLVRLLARQTTNDDEVCHCPYFSINDFLSFVFGEYNK